MPARYLSVAAVATAFALSACGSGGNNSQQIRDLQATVAALTARTPQAITVTATPSPAPGTATTEPTAVPTAEPTPAPTEAPSPSPAPATAVATTAPVTTFPSGSVVQVNTPGDCLVLRAAPSSTATKVDCRKDGESLRVTGTAVTANGQAWLPVSAVTNGASGWASAAFVRVALVAPAAPAPQAPPRPVSPPAAARPVSDGLPHNTCSKSDALKAGAVLNAGFRSFNDTYDLSQQTPRIQLAGVIAQMQQEKRDMATLVIPACSEPTRAAIVQSELDFINVMLAFLGQSDISALSNIATASAQEATRLVKELGSQQQ